MTTIVARTLLGTYKVNTYKTKYSSTLTHPKTFPRIINMQLEITRVFTPSYKDTGIVDYRFNEDLQAISQSLEVSTIRGLAEFAKKKLELENAYGGYAVKITEAFIERVEFVKDSKDESNKHNWKGKVLMKTLRKGLAEIGFKAQHITKTIGAVSFMRWINPSDTFEPCDFGGSIEEHE